MDDCVIVVKPLQNIRKMPVKHHQNDDLQAFCAFILRGIKISFQEEQRPFNISKW
jgi:hypothetical protein